MGQNTNNTVAKATSNADETIAAFQNESTPTQEVETTETQEVEETETNRDEVLNELKSKAVSMQSHLGINAEEQEIVSNIINEAFPDPTQYGLKQYQGGSEAAKKGDKVGSIALRMLKTTGENPRFGTKDAYDVETLAEQILTMKRLTSPIHVIENNPEITGIQNPGSKAIYYIVLDGHRRISAIELLLAQGKIDATSSLVMNVPIVKVPLSWTKENWRERVTEYMLKQSGSVKPLHFVEFTNALLKVTRLANKTAGEWSKTLLVPITKMKQYLDLVKFVDFTGDSQEEALEIEKTRSALFLIIQEKEYTLTDVLNKLKEFKTSFTKENNIAPDLNDILIFLSEAKVSKRGRISEKNMTEAEKEQFEKDRLAKAQAEAQEANAKVAALSGNASQASQNSLSESTNSTSENEGSAESDVALTMEQKHNRAKIEGRMALFSENAPTILNEKLSQNLITQEQYDAAIVALNVVSNLNILVTTVLTKGKTFEEQVLDVLGITLPVQSDTENPDTI
jgi:hypothetical protein